MEVKFLISVKKCGRMNAEKINITSLKYIWFGIYMWLDSHMKKLENGYYSYGVYGYSYGVYGYANDKMRCTNEFSS